MPHRSATSSDRSVVLGFHWTLPNSSTQCFSCSPCTRQTAGSFKLLLAVKTASKTEVHAAGHANMLLLGLFLTCCWCSWVLLLLQGEDDGSSIVPVAAYLESRDGGWAVGLQRGGGG
jgi:hypothetical protein